MAVVREDIQVVGVTEENAEDEMEMDDSLWRRKQMKEEKLPLQIAYVFCCITRRPNCFRDFPTLYTSHRKHKRFFGQDRAATEYCLPSFTCN